MKKNIFLFFGLCVITVFMVSCNSNSNTEIVKKKDVVQLKKLHKENLEKSPFTERLKLTKQERKDQRLSPNKYNDEMWELTMNPELGRPTPFKVAELQKELIEQRRNELLAGRVPGDALDNGWTERGPNNVGGRTRAMMFDPNDASDNTVFAGGVSGGLWKNSNISSGSSVWERVGIPENLAVSVITYDPNDTDTFYVGTGESYVGHTDGSVNGDGVWKSEDGGDTWENIFGGSSGDSYFQSASSITVNSPVSIAGNYLATPTTNFGPEITTAITADIILADDSSGVPAEACNSFGPDATDKIAIIRRGDCPFVEKVKNAQNAGAIAVIMMNNVPGDPIPMGGTDGTITIPAIMITQADGDLLETGLASGDVNVTLNPASGEFTAVVVPGIQQINDIIVKDNGGVSEIYVASGEAIYGSSNAGTTVSGDAYGLYKSSDGGDNWSELDVPLTAAGRKHEPNDLDYDADGTIWMSTTRSSLFGDGGGIVFSSVDEGTTFTVAYTVADGVRTQIAASKINGGKVYLLAELSTGGVTIKSTTTGFVPLFLVQNKPLPNDLDGGIDASDFTRGQAFYDLMLDIHPTNDNIVMAGGINLFKSSDGANNWSQLSSWYGGFRQYVHGDQHIAAFGHNDPNKMIFGNDGGVYYSSNGGTTILDRNTGYNTSQFYTVGVGPTAAFTTGDYFAGGLQDNGTQLFQNANPTGTDSSTEPYGGDGAYTFFDQDGSDRYFIRNYVYNAGINLYNFIGADVTINSESLANTNGSFINPQALDSNLDILYSNYSTTGNYVIKRYAGIKAAATLVKTDLTDATLTTIPTAFTVSPYTTTSSKLLVGTILGDILLVENADTTPTWTALDQNVLVGSVSDVEYGESENDIFVTMHNYGVNNVWYSSDGGSNWEAKDGNLPDLPVKAILQNPLNLEEVIIGTELGVWYTNNFSSNSPTWSPAFNGMSNVKVLDLDLRDDNMVFAATHGRGIFSGLFTPESLSVEESNLGVFSIYPNPSNGNINIRTAQNYGDAVATIYDMNGRKVFSNTLTLNQQSNLKAKNLSSGMYILKIQGLDFSHSEKLIIKQ